MKGVISWLWGFCVGGCFMAKSGGFGAVVIGLAVIGGMLGLGKSNDTVKTAPAPQTQSAALLQAPVLPPAASAANTTAIVPASKPFVPPPVEQSKPRLVVSGHNVPMRADPAPKTAIIDRLKQGLAVEEVERQDGWVKVRHPVTAAEGWVKASLVRAEADTSAAEKPKAETAKPSVGPVLATSIIVARLLAESRADYPGNCACPEDRDKRGHRCGARSAYSRPGGYAPLCYPHDVTPAMIAEYRQTHTADAR